MIDTSAAMNVGRVLAKRCVDSGILNCIPDARAVEIERSMRVSIYLYEIYFHLVVLEQRIFQSSSRQWCDVDGKKANRALLYQRS
jgi:hypothetical protein